jgi:hypothetical protein
MADSNRSLTWVDACEPIGGFRPVKLRSARTPEGLYEVFQSGEGFDAWFTRSNGPMAFLGSSRSARAARERCERRQQENPSRMRAKQPAGGSRFWQPDPTAGGQVQGS